MKGKVFLVGAGPGALDLLTVRAVQLLQRADVVLHDELVPHDFANLLRPTAIRLNVGKRCGKPGASQESINALMVRYAREGRRVVRLKCGDPSVFGRLGEEMDALREAGIQFEVVPGVTAAFAAASAAQVSLTDRRIASRVVLAAGSLANNEQQDWGRCIEQKTTLVIYMPGRDYAVVAGNLLRAGADPDMPCAVVARAGALDEEVRRTTVSKLPELSAAASPSVLLIGEVVRSRQIWRVAAAALADDSDVRQQVWDQIAAEESPQHGI